MTREELDIVVVGGGPAGLSAAITAARAGGQVVLFDAYPAPGGQYYRQPPARREGHATGHQKEGRHLWQEALGAGVTIRSGTVVWNGTAEKVLSYTSPEGTGEVKARAVILASGAYEQPVAFPGWTLPGVLTAGGIQTLLYQHVLPGRRVLLAGTGPLQLVVAKKLLDAGVQIAGVLEGSGNMFATGMRGALAMWGQWERMFEGASSIGIMALHRVPYRMGWGLVAVNGSDQVERATIARLDADWRPIRGTEQEVVCDTVGIEYGLTPFSTLSKIMGATQVWRSDLGGEVPVRDDLLQTSVADLYAVGDGAGIGGIRVSLLEGELAGAAAAFALEGDKTQGEKVIGGVLRKLAVERRFQRLYADLFTPGPGVFELATDDTLICRCEGVTLRQVREALALGATALPEVKRMTRCGMGECQGRTCCHQVVHILARECGVTPDAIGGYEVRPPLFPLPVGALAQAAGGEEPEV